MSPTLTSTVDDVMTRCPLGVRADAPLRTVAAVLFGNAISAVPVLDEQGRPVGVISEGDVVRARRGAGSAGDVMSAPALTVTPDEPVAGALRRLMAAGVRRLFVVDGDGRLVGVLSRRDLLAGYLRADEDIRAGVEHDVRAVLSGSEFVSVTVRDGVVLLLGRVGWRDELAKVSEVAAAVPGVVAVRNRMGFFWDAVRPRRSLARSAR